MFLCLVENTCVIKIVQADFPSWFFRGGRGNGLTGFVWLVQGSKGVWGQEGVSMHAYTHVSIACAQRSNAFYAPGLWLHQTKGPASLLTPFNTNAPLQNFILPKQKCITSGRNKETLTTKEKRYIQFFYEQNHFMAKTNYKFLSENVF